MQVWEVGRSGPGCQNSVAVMIYKANTLPVRGSLVVVMLVRVDIELVTYLATTQVWEGSSKDVKCVAGVTTNSATAINCVSLYYLRGIR